MIPDICLPINYDVQIEDVLRIRETPFGENYTQTSEDRLNPELQTLTLKTFAYRLWWSEDGKIF